MIYSIVAYGQNRVIGKDNKLPWGRDLPADLQHFRELTTGNTVVMGRKTYESIGRPLPNRQNIVISRDADYVAEGCEVVSSLEQAFERAEHDVYIIGGATIYELAEPYVDVLCATEIQHDFDGDTTFTLQQPDEWTEISRQSHSSDERNKYSYDFVEYKHEKTER